ncbi:MAG: hemoglobin [Methylophilaceae bacterium]|jgi:hemoglobin|tara:strand:+ start:780 stop:1199 length:420 start_codon:yes stop_codon:yes gene_type:complete
MLDKIEEVESDKSTLYELLGGDESGIENIRLLVETFYDMMDSSEKATELRAIHAPDLTEAREKLFMFLTGWTGGPQLYIEQYGHPRLRARHMPFSIGETERDQWMFCMISAMHEISIEEPILTKMATQLYGVADFMRNK